MSEELLETAAAPVCHVGVKRDAAGALQPEVPVGELGRAIEQDEQLVILRGAYTNDGMRELRRMILDWAEATEAWPQGVSASKEAINFHRVDDGSITGRMAHIFHQFGLGDPGTLSEPLRGEIVRTCREIFDLQNRLAGTEFPFETPSFRIKAIRHPRGGGYLVPHTHPYLPQKVAVFLNLSEPGEDYRSGGARYRRSDGRWVDIHQDFRAGDLLAWRYSMVHEVKPVDPDAEIDWKGDDGFTLMAMEWVPSHERSDAVQG